MTKLTIDEKVALWDEVNKYVRTCGGDPSKHVYGNLSRQLAVVSVEKCIEAAIAARTTPAKGTEQGDRR